LENGYFPRHFLQFEKQLCGLIITELCRQSQLEEENSKLKRIFNVLSLDKEMLQDVLIKALKGHHRKELAVSPLSWFYPDT